MVKSVLIGHSKEDKKKDFNTDNRFMHVKSIAEHSAVLLTCIKIPNDFQVIVLLFEWPLKTGIFILWKTKILSSLSFQIWCYK